MRYNTSTNYFVLQVMRKKNSQLHCIVVDFFFLELAVAEFIWMRRWTGLIIVIQEENRYI